MLSNSAVTVHHLASLDIGLYSLSTDMLSTCLLSDVFQIEGCLAGLDVGAMACMLTQGDGYPVPVDTTKEDRLCQACHSYKDVEDEQHSMFSCPAYSDVRQKHASLFQQACLRFFHYL